MNIGVWAERMLAVEGKPYSKNKFNSNFNPDDLHTLGEKEREGEERSIDTKNEFSVKILGDGWEKLWVVWGSSGKGERESFKEKK